MMVTFGEKWHDECHKQEGNLFQGQPLPQQTAYEESFQVLNVYLHAMESKCTGLWTVPLNSISLL